MPRLIIKTYKRPDDDWILTIPPYVEQYFTQDEIETVLEPADAQLRNIKGYINTIKENNLEDNVYTSIRHFETKEGVMEAIEILRNNELMIEKRNLMLEKLSEYGYIYRVEYLTD